MCLSYKIQNKCITIFTNDLNHIKIIYLINKLVYKTKYYS